MKKLKLLLLLLSLSLSKASFAVSTSATIATIADSVGAGLTGVPELLVAMSYVFGIVLGIKSVLKLKEHNESKGQVKIGIPIALAIASALFLALPQLMTVGREAVGYNQVGSAPSVQY